LAQRQYLAHKVLIKMMDPVATLMEREFIPEQDAVYQFDSNLWREAFYMLLKLLSSEQLVIEEFSPQVSCEFNLITLLILTIHQKRRAVWRLAGDIRGDGATILLRLWLALGWPDHGPANPGAGLPYGVSDHFLSLPIIPC
jgi:dedicator of cytokinesis protein 3